MINSNLKIKEEQNFDESAKVLMDSGLMDLYECKLTRLFEIFMQSRTP
jgi:hypothetical protein